MLSQILDRLSGKRETIITMQRRLTAVPALSPTNEGQGEWAKTRVAMDLLTDIGLPVTRIMAAPDDRVPEKSRPNLAAVLPGKDTSRTLWIISHIDVVPPGDLSLWSGDPYTLRVDGDKIYGRGVEDNQQGIVSSLILAQSLLETGATPPINLGVLLVADEETGSTYGLEYVVREHRELFGPSDLFIIPDFGRPDSAVMEVAEKSLFWLKVTVIGRQCHASTPGEGVNSLVAAADLIVRLRGLYDLFPQRDELFNPATSTFEPTKKDANVENINSLPGRDVFYVDCRILPQVSVVQVMSAIESMGAAVAQAHGVTVQFEDVRREAAAPATSPEAEVVQRLSRAITAVYGQQPKPTGIGGGTVAAVLRKAGLPAVVWATLEHNAHQPDERSSIAFTIGDAQVLARVLFDG